MGWPYQQKPPMGWPLDLDSGLADFVGAWFMLEGSGNKIFDLSGNGNTGTFVGDVSWVSGKFGPALNFPGSTDYINCGNSPTIAFVNTDFTISLWMKQDSTDAFRVLIGNDLTGADGWGLMTYTDDTGNILLYIDDGFKTSSASVIPNANQWYHIVVVFHLLSENASFYIDGVFDNLSTTYGRHIDALSGDNVIIGVDPRDTIGLDFDGDLDHILLYNRALSASEIALLYREPFCMFKDPAELALLGGYQAAGGTILPQITTAYIRMAS